LFCKSFLLRAELPPGVEDTASGLAFGGAEGSFDGIEATASYPGVPEGVNGIDD
jgi:hypothetical protein